MNAFITLLDRAQNQNMCSQPHCTTCGSQPFRQALAAIDTLQTDLESVDFDELRLFPGWQRTLRLVAMSTARSLNWGAILQAWLPVASREPDFLDTVLAFVIPTVSLPENIREQWVAAGVASLEQSVNESLLESLIRFHRHRLPNPDHWVSLAKQRARNGSPLRSALIATGDLTLPPPVRAERLRERAEHNLPAAIRRGDVTAVQAMLSRGVDLDTPLPDGKNLRQLLIDSESPAIRALLGG